MFKNASDCHSVTAILAAVSIGVTRFGSNIRSCRFWDRHFLIRNHGIVYSTFLRAQVLQWRSIACDVACWVFHGIFNNAANIICQFDGLLHSWIVSQPAQVSCYLGRSLGVSIGLRHRTRVRSLGCGIGRRFVPGHGLQQWHPSARQWHTLPRFTNTMAFSPSCARKQEPKAEKRSPGHGTQLHMEILTVCSLIF